MTATTRTPEKDARFLELLREGASIAAACRGAGYSRSRAYAYRAEDPDLAAAIADAIEEGTDALEDEAMRRAKDGVDEPRFYEGVECGTVRRYSDTLAIFLLKGRRPHKFKERQEHTGADGSPLLSGITVNFVKPSNDGEG